MLKIADEAVCGSRRESQRVSPEIPLEDNDSIARCNCPDQEERTFAAGKSGVQEC